jgi:hypothetical protein
MRWAENRVAEYQRGRPASWVEQRILERANPVHFWLQVASVPGFIYGLWTHNWFWIVGMILLGVFAHAYSVGWAKRRIADYQHGKSASWLERRTLEHANPVNIALTVVATLGLLYGLWTHDWLWIVGSALLGFLGHVYCWTRKNGEKRGETKLAESGTASAPAR